MGGGRVNIFRLLRRLFTGGVLRDFTLFTRRGRRRRRFFVRRFLRDLFGIIPFPFVFRGAITF
jgi:hypothetical protein